MLNVTSPSLRMTNNPQRGRWGSHDPFLHNSGLWKIVPRLVDLACLTAFNNEAYTASHFVAPMAVHIVMLYNKTPTQLLRFVVDLLQFKTRIDNKSNQWSLSLTVHICAKSRQLPVYVAKCCQYRQMLSPGECTRRPTRHCMQRDMVDWAWGSVAWFIGVSRYYLSLHYAMILDTVEHYVIARYQVYCMCSKQRCGEVMYSNYELSTVCAPFSSKTLSVLCLYFFCTPNVVYYYELYDKMLTIANETR